MADTARLFVDGAWADAASGATFTADSPATGEAIAEVSEGGREDAQRAIAAANEAAGTWARTGAFERAGAMHRVADEVERRRDTLTHTLTLDQGKPLSESRDEVDELVHYWRNAAEDAKRLEGRVPNSVSGDKRVLLLRRPRGVIGVITPWNWPYTMPAELVAPALACGNTVVWTPASTTAVVGAALAECVAEADLPPGVFNFVTGPGATVGDEIARNPGTHGVGFIGSTETGRRVAEAAAGKAAVLELGGNGPVVVLEDGRLSGRGLGDLPAGLGRADEADAVRPGVARDLVADHRAGAGDEVEDARRQVGLRDTRRECGAAHRRGRRRRPDDGVAGRERRGDQLRRHRVRPVPGRDHADHAARPAHEQHALAGRERVREPPLETLPVLGRVPPVRHELLDLVARLV